MTWLLITLGILRVDLVAVTFDGNVFIAGSGSDCAEAFHGAVFPDNWRSLSCQVVLNHF